MTCCVQAPSSALNDRLYTIELQRGARGFGFSIRGGREFNNMQLFILKIADGGPAHTDGRLQVHCDRMVFLFYVLLWCIVISGCIHLMVWNKNCFVKKYCSQFRRWTFTQRTLQVLLLPCVTLFCDITRLQKRPADISQPLNVRILDIWMHLFCSNFVSIYANVLFLPSCLLSFFLFLYSSLSFLFAMSIFVQI